MSPRIQRFLKTLRRLALVIGGLSVVVAAGFGHYRKEPDGTERLHTDVTPHVLKHTGTTWLLRDGVDLWDVSGLTSTSTKTLEGVYGHHSPDYQKASAKAFRRKA